MPENGRGYSDYEVIDEKDVCIDDEIPFDDPEKKTWMRFGCLERKNALSRDSVNSRPGMMNKRGIDIE